MDYGVSQRPKFVGRLHWLQNPNGVLKLRCHLNLVLLVLMWSGHPCVQMFQLHRFLIVQGCHPKSDLELYKVTF